MMAMKWMNQYPIQNTYKKIAVKNSALAIGSTRQVEIRTLRRKAATMVNKKVLMTIISKSYNVIIIIEK